MPERKGSKKASKFALAIGIHSLTCSAAASKFAKARVDARGGPAKSAAGSKKSKADKKAIRRDRRASEKGPHAGAGDAGGSKKKNAGNRSFEGERASPAAAQSVKREIHRTQRNKSHKGNPHKPSGKRNSAKGKHGGGGAGKPSKPSFKKDSIKKQRLSGGKPGSKKGSFKSAPRGNKKK